MRPARLHLTKNGVDVSRNINKSTQEINSIINASPEVFRNCVIMSLNNTLPFMMQSKVEKRKFIEGILRLDMFSDMLLDARKEISELSKDFDIKRTIVNEKTSALRNYTEQQQRQRADQQAQVRQLKQRIDSNIARIQTINESLTQCDAQNIDVEQLRQNIALLRGQQDSCIADIQTHVRMQASLQERIKTITRDIDRIKRQPAVCPTCRRPYEDHNQQQIVDELQQLTNDRDTVYLEIADVDKRLKKYEALSANCKRAVSKLTEQIDSWHRQQSQRDTAAAQISQLDEYNAQLLRDIVAIDNKSDQYDQLIDQAKTELEASKTEVEKIHVSLEVLELARFVVSEEGVKSYIIKKMLKLFNSRLKYYLHKLNANCSCEFNEYFEETIIDQQGNEVSYANFSGGEGKRIDLAMLFTFQDIRRLQADSSINVCIYDELFDSSLDNVGVMAVIDILRERNAKYGEAIYIITHRNDSVKLLEDVGIIHLEKKNNITSISQYETAI